MWALLQSFSFLDIIENTLTEVGPRISGETGPGGDACFISDIVACKWTPPMGGLSRVDFRTPDWAGYASGSQVSWIQRKLEAMLLQMCHGGGSTRCQRGLWGRTDMPQPWGGDIVWGKHVADSMEAALEGGGPGFYPHWCEQRIQWLQPEWNAVGALEWVAQWHTVYLQLLLSLVHLGNQGLGGRGSFTLQ